MGRTVIRALAIATLALTLATACGWLRGPATTIPDTAPDMTDPPADAMEPCPTAEREGTGTGYLPSAGDGTQGELVRAGATVARYLATCDARHETLRQHIRSYIRQQRGLPEPSQTHSPHPD